MELTITAPAAQAYTGTPVFFFAPHQDDETLFMGAAVRQHVLAGRKVYVVLMTDGGASGVCKRDYPGDRAGCVAERDREFVAAVRSMGAIPIIRTDRMADGTLTVAYAKKVILSYYANVNYKLASYKTMSETDASPDHANLGKGLAAAHITDSRWYMKRTEWGTHPIASVSGPYDLNATLELYRPIGWASVPAEFEHATYPEGAISKAYKH